MPLTTAAFSIGALGMIGVQWTAGYVSKTYLLPGAEAGGAAWADWVLTTSSVLNAAYFLPILYRAWLKRPAGPWPNEHSARRGWRETATLLLLPPLVATGVLADHDWSPLSWAKLIAARQYLQ